MATVEGTAKVKVDGVDAAAQLDKLESKAAQLRKEIIEIRKQPIVDQQKLKSLQTALSGVNKEIKDVKAQTISYQAVLKNLSGASLKELQKAYKQLNIETSKLDRTTTQYKKNASDMVRIKAEISKVKSELNGAGAQAQGFGAKLKGIATQLFAGGGLIAAFYMVGRALKGAFDIITNYDKATSNLQAILGKTKDEIRDLTVQSKALGASTAFTATQVTDMQTELARLGFEIKEIVDATPAMQPNVWHERCGCPPNGNFHRAVY